MAEKFIRVRGARENNLKNIDVDIPRNKLTVVTGLSGSGKSTLVFDTIYAEGQRRYTESLSTYARQFLSMGKKPDVESIDGLSPAIAIDQKSTTRNPRSTVGTVTEIYDYLRLLFARVGSVHCYKCDILLSSQSPSEMVEVIQKNFAGKRTMLLAPIAKGKKGSHEQIFESARADGFVRIRLDGKIHTLDEEINLDKQQKHDIEIVVDRLKVPDTLDDSFRKRAADSVEIALKMSRGTMIILDADDEINSQFFNEKMVCSKCGVNMPEIEPRSFSFNSPHGACTACHGLGTRLTPNEKMIIPNTTLTLNEGAIHPWRSHNFHSKMLIKLAEIENFDLDTPWCDLSDHAKKIVLHGYGEEISPQFSIEADSGSKLVSHWEGVMPWISRRYRETENDTVREHLEDYMQMNTCDECEGRRLRSEVMGIRINNKNIYDITAMNVDELITFFENIKLD